MGARGGERQATVPAVNGRGSWLRWVVRSAGDATRRRCCKSGGDSQKSTNSASLTFSFPCSFSALSALSVQLPVCLIRTLWALSGADPIVSRRPRTISALLACHRCVQIQQSPLLFWCTPSRCLPWLLVGPSPPDTSLGGFLNLLPALSISPQRVVLWNRINLLSNERNSRNINYIYHIIMTYRLY